MTYQEFEAKIDAIDDEIKQAEHAEQHTRLICLDQMRKRLVEEWQTPAES